MPEAWPQGHVSHVSYICYATSPNNESSKNPTQLHGNLLSKNGKMIRYVLYSKTNKNATTLWPLTVKSSFTSRLTWLNTLWMSTNRIPHFIIFHPLVHHLLHEMILLRQNHIKKRHRNHRNLTCHLQELCGFSHGGRTWVFWTWNSSAFESGLGM